MTAARAGRPPGVTRMGRPPVPSGARRTVRVEVRCSEDEARDLRAYAEREGVALAEAVREAALRAARWRP